MSKMGDRLQGVWDNPNVSDKAIVDGLMDLEEDVTDATQDALDSMQSVIGIIMRNPTYNDYTRDELLPMVEKLSNIKRQFTAATNELLFEVTMALRHYKE